MSLSVGCIYHEPISKEVFGGPGALTGQTDRCWVRVRTRKGGGFLLARQEANKASRQSETAVASTYVQGKAPDQIVVISCCKVVHEQSDAVHQERPVSSRHREVRVTSFPHAAQNVSSRRVILYARKVSCAEISSRPTIFPWRDVCSGQSRVRKQSNTELHVPCARLRNSLSHS